MGTGPFESVGSRGRKLFAPPSDKVVPYVIPVGKVVAGNDRVRVLIESLSCWPDGFTMNLAAFYRSEIELETVRPILGHPLDSMSTLDANELAIGVSYADGRLATTVDRLKYDLDIEDSLVLSPSNFFSGPGYLRQGIYIRPIPPPGSVVVSARWSAQDLGEGSVELPSQSIVEGVKLVVSVWG